MSLPGIVNLLDLAENAGADTEQTEQAKTDEAAGESTMLTDNAEAGDAAMDGEREMMTRPSVEREGYQQADMEAVRRMMSKDLEGTAVYGANDESVSEIESLVLDESGKVGRVVINVGGFLGLGEKPVAVTFDKLQFLQAEGGGDLRIYIDSSEEALENQPEFED